MPKNKPKINYQLLVLNTVKEKYLFLVIGFVVTFSIGYISFFHLPSTKFWWRMTKQIPQEKNKQMVKSTESNKIYETQEGDYLWKIAEDQYGSGFNAYDIAKANNLSDPYNLIKGQKLILPKLTPKPPTKGETSSISTSQVTHQKDTYTVQPGDFLWSIAVKVYGDGYAADRIIKANNLSNINVLEPGTILKIPR